MSASTENIRALSDLGLDFDQAKMYLAILRSESIPLGRIAEVANITKEETYRNLSKLEEIGLVEKVLSRPIQVRPLPVEHALTNLIGIEQTKTNTPMASIKMSTAKFLIRYKKQRPRQTKDHFIMLTERESIIKKATQIIDKSKKEIGAMFSENMAKGLLPAYENALRKALAKGVKIRLITEHLGAEYTTSNFLNQYLPQSNNLEFKCYRKPANQCIIADCRQALTSTMFNNPFAEKPHLWTDEPPLVSLIAVNFESIWSRAAIQEC
jgi:sugar-specific transcriptional regulator TrmB